MFHNQTVRGAEHAIKPASLATAMPQNKGLIPLGASHSEGLVYGVVIVLILPSDMMTSCSFDQTRPVF